MSGQVTNANPDTGGFIRTKRPMYTGQQHLDAQVEDVTPTPQPGPGESSNSEDEDRALTPEEQTYKKRYADLRREQQRQAGIHKEALASMEAKINALQNGSKTLPISEAELNDWMNRYPDLAAAILRLADQTASEKVRILSEKMAKLEEQSSEVERDKAYLELKRLHPDVDDIRESEEFRDWANDAPPEIQDWFFEKNDPILAAKGISMFKAETGWGRKKRQSTRQEQLEGTRTVPMNAPVQINPEGGNKKQWRESEIKKLTPKQFEAQEDEIMLAWQEGRIIKDLQNSKA